MTVEQASLQGGVTQIPLQSGTRAKSKELRKKMPDLKLMTGAEIKEMRTRIGISQALLAYTMGMSVESVSKWERDEIKPSGAALRLLNVINAKGIEIFTQ